jgi:hypothetical protein
MSTSVTKLPDEPIVVVSLGADYNLRTELPKAVPQYLEMLAHYDEPVFWIVDLSAVLLSVEDVVFGANMLARSENPLYHHPKVREVVYVTPVDALQAAAQGMDSRAFGHVKISVTNTLDEALAQVRAG